MIGKETLHQEAVLAKVQRGAQSVVFEVTTTDEWSVRQTALEPSVNVAVKAAQNARARVCRVFAGSRGVVHRRR